MTHKHHSHVCKHQIRYCEPCDVAYCSKCGREYRANYNWTWTYPFGGTTYTTTDYTSTSGSQAIGSTGVQSYHQHD